MEKEYILLKLEQRIEELRLRYSAALKDQTEFGEPITSKTAAVYRSDYKKQLNVCFLIRELVLSNPKKMILLSEEAIDGLEKYIEPLERHRRLK